MKLMTPLSPLGKELGDLLREKLGIPETVTKFSVHFSNDDFVTVDCTYAATEPEDGDG